MPSLLILGRQPELGLAELESLYGAASLDPVANNVVVVKKDACAINFSRLGGSIRLCNVLESLPTTDWLEIVKLIEEKAPEHVVKMAKGKMTLGLSVYGIETSPKEIISGGIRIKKAIQQTGRSVRFVPNRQNELNSAQVIHNKLTGDRGWELVFVKDGHNTICAQTIFVQDIADYTKRDRNRPKRDMRIGMLPPKLAQIIINLASSSDNDAPKGLLLDAFCGTGVLLQEALLMGYGIFGSDISTRMIEYSQTNLDWLTKSYRLKSPNYKLEVGDASIMKWPDSIKLAASELYLGPAFVKTPSLETINRLSSEISNMVRGFLINLAKQTKPGLKVCLAIPAWKLSNGFKHLDKLDHLTDIGYNRLSFKHVQKESLIYYREGQIVGRELLILERI